MDRPQPAHTIRFGRVKATIWANESLNGTWHSVQVHRLYKDGDEWRQSDNFSRDDLPVVCKALDLAHTWIFEQAQCGPSTTGNYDVPKSETAAESQGSSA